MFCFTSFLPELFPILQHQRRFLEKRHVGTDRNQKPRQYRTERRSKDSQADAPGESERYGNNSKQSSSLSPSVPDRARYSNDSRPSSSSSSRQSDRNDSRFSASSSSVPDSMLSNGNPKVKTPRYNSDRSMSDRVDTNSAPRYANERSKLDRSNTQLTSEQLARDKFKSNSNGSERFRSDRINGNAAGSDF